MLASVRQKLWILRGHAAVGRVIGKCYFWNARPCEQIMAPLPSARVSPCLPPFSSVGVDYFGPILVKSRRSQVKRYGCVFTCLAVRDLHIETAYQLITDSFRQAFTRFVSKRGPPIEVYSDNRTNFKGTEVEIKTALERWSPDPIDNSLRKGGIKRNFNPPHASHAGGVWERMIRSICRILHALLGSQFVDYETLPNVMAKVE